MDSNGPDAFAGLWEGWKTLEGDWLHTFTIITTTANEATQHIHDRMPVILPPDRRGAWLDEEGEVSPAELQDMLAPGAGRWRLVAQVVANTRWNSRLDAWGSERCFSRKTNQST